MKTAIEQLLDTAGIEYKDSDDLGNYEKFVEFFIRDIENIVRTAIELDGPPSESWESGYASGMRNTVSCINEKYGDE